MVWRSSPGSGNKSTTAGGEKGSRLSSRTVSPTSSNGCAKSGAGHLATHLLRSAMDWGGSKIDTLEQKAVVNPKDNDTMEQKDECSDEKDLGRLVKVEAEPDTATADDLVTARTDQEFEVTYMCHCLSDVEGMTKGVKEEKACDFINGRSMQFLDVLLQTDEHGIGLNVSLERVKRNEECVLVVQSFRRLSKDDVGPAEACGKIRAGDILHAVDGEGVGSLRQLRTKLAGRLGKHKKFVLLRFLRPLAVLDDLEMPTAIFAPRRQSVDENENYGFDSDGLLRASPQIALLVRQLAITNEQLQNQLIASRLKQEEQNLQLDQLHALYAQTQAEGLSLFSVSKSVLPFSRRTSYACVGDEREKPVPTRIQTEVIDAIDVEYNRLRHKFQLQYHFAKQELEQNYAEKVRKLEEASTKKMEMLEAGFDRALQQLADGHHCACQCPLHLVANNKTTSTTCCEVDAARMTLRHILSVVAEYKTKKLFSDRKSGENEHRREQSKAV